MNNARQRIQFFRMQQTSARLVLASRRAFVSFMRSIVLNQVSQVIIDDDSTTAAQLQLEYVQMLTDRVRPHASTEVEKVLAPVSTIVDLGMWVLDALMGKPWSRVIQRHNHVAAAVDNLPAFRAGEWDAFFRAIKPHLATLEREVYTLPNTKPLANSSATTIQRAFRRRRERAKAATTIQKHYRRGVQRRAMRDLVDHLTWQPGGPGYEAARRRFEERAQEGGRGQKRGRK